MRSRQSLMLRAVLAASLAAAALTDGALAQTSRPGSEPPAATSRSAATQPATTTGRGLLAGPLVEPEAMGETPGRNARNQRDRRSQGVAARRWLALVRELDLSGEQRAALGVILSELAAARRDFQSEYGAELRELRRQVGGRGGRQSDRPVDPQKRRRLQMIQSEAPQASTYQRRVWDQLTPAQQNELRTRIARERATRNRPRSDRKP